MMFRTRLTLLSLIGGIVLMILGFGLSVTFKAMNVPIQGPAGVWISACLGAGFCLLLFALIRRLIPNSNLQSLDVRELSEEQYLNRIGQLRLHCAKLTVLFTAAAAAFAVSLYVVGVVVAFANFNFASGIGDTGFVIVFTSICIGLIAVLSNLVGIVASWIAFQSTGGYRWFLFALFLPILFGSTFLVMQSRL